MRCQICITCPACIEKQLKRQARSRSIVKYLLLGMTNLEIAKETGLAERTVKGHVAKLLRWYDIKNRVQLCVLLMKEENAAHSQGKTSGPVDIARSEQ